MIKSDFTVHMFFRHVEMNTIRDYKILKHLTDQNILEIRTENMKKMNTVQQQSKTQNMFFILELLMLFLLLM